jgi:hypothetical protein
MDLSACPAQAGNAQADGNGLSFKESRRFGMTSYHKKSGITAGKKIWQK